MTYPEPCDHLNTSKASNQRGDTMNQPTTDKAKYVAQRANLVAIINGVPFYEHPELGDEVPLLYITKEGKVKRSDFYEVPEVQDLPFDAIA